MVSGLVRAAQDPPGPGPAPDRPTRGTRLSRVRLGAGSRSSTFLDALAALGDRERIEAEAPNWLQQGTFAEPFALRALGIARGDRALLRQALERFEAMDLPWHVEQTRHLL